MASEEIIVPFDTPRAQVPLGTHVRGSVLVASLRGLRAQDLLDRYLALLDEPRRERILSTTAASWQPVGHAVEHYTTCDKLGLPPGTIDALGAASGRFLNATLLGIIVRMTHEAGVTPWAAFAQSRRLLGRTWQGSAASVIKLGPKEARFEWVGQPAAISPYFRLAFGGFLGGVLTLFCRTAFIRQIPRLCSPTTVAYRCSWV